MQARNKISAVRRIIYNLLNMWHVEKQAINCDNNNIHFSEDQENNAAWETSKELKEKQNTLHQRPEKQCKRKNKQLTTRK